MDREIEIHDYDRVYDTRSFLFPGGELQVQIPNLPPKLLSHITVIARLQSSDDVMRLVLTNDILDRHRRSTWKRLAIPYFPYARQDRVMQPGEAFSLKAFAGVINGLGFDDVIVCDPHSDVTAAVVDNLRAIEQSELVRNHPGVRRLVAEESPLLIAPDAGALKKAMAVAKVLELSAPLIASKVRDVRTGEITDTRLDDPENRVRGQSCLIVDDLCDGGRTFIELARLLRRHGARCVFLYVTHGIFSKGYDVFESCLDGIYTTDSFLPNHVSTVPSLPVDRYSVRKLLTTHDV